MDESSLTEEHGAKIRWSVRIMAKKAQWHRECQLLHGVRIDRTAERTGIEHVESLVPVVRGLVEDIVDVFSTQFETLDKQVLKPGGDVDTADFGET